MMPEYNKLTPHPLKESDCDAISRFATSVEELFHLAPNARFPWTADQMLQTLPDRLANTVFTIDKDLVGFANFYSFETGKQAFIGNLLVNPLYRSQGIGKAIIRQMLETGFQQFHFNEIHISCFSSNTRGLLLYKKLGFVPYGIEQRTNHANEPIALINLKHNSESYMQYMNSISHRNTTRSQPQ